MKEASLEKFFFFFSKVFLVKIRVSKVYLWDPPPRLPTCQCSQWRTADSHLYDSHKHIPDVFSVSVFPLLGHICICMYVYVFPLA